MEMKPSLAGPEAARPMLSPEATEEPGIGAENRVAPTPATVGAGKEGTKATMRGDPSNQATAALSVADATTASEEEQIATVPATVKQRSGEQAAGCVRRAAKDTATGTELLPSAAATEQEIVTAASGGRACTAKTGPAGHGDRTLNFAAAVQYAGCSAAAAAEQSGTGEAAMKTNATSGDQLLTQLEPAIIPQAAALPSRAANAKTTEGETTVDVALVSEAFESPAGGPSRTGTARETTQPSCAECRVTQEPDAPTQSKQQVCSTSNYSSLNTISSTSIRITNNGISEERNRPTPPFHSCPVPAESSCAGSCRCAPAGSPAPGPYVVIATAAAARDGYNDTLAGGAAALPGAATCSDTPTWASSAAIAPAVGDSNEKLRPEGMGRTPQHLEQDLWLLVKKGNLQQQTNSWEKTTEVLSLQQQQQQQSNSCVDQHEQDTRIASGSVHSYVEASSPSALADLPRRSVSGPLPPLLDKVEGVACTPEAATGQAAALYTAETAPAAAAFVCNAMNGARQENAVVQGLAAATDTDAKAPDDTSKGGGVGSAAITATATPEDKAPAAVGVSPGVSAAETREFSIDESTVNQQVEGKLGSSLLLPGKQLKAGQETRDLNFTRAGAGAAFFDPVALRDASAESSNSTTLPAAAVEGAPDGNAAAWVASNPSVADSTAEADPPTVLSANVASSVNTSSFVTVDTARSAITVSATLFPLYTSDPLAITSGNVTPNSVLDVDTGVPAAPAEATCKADGSSTTGKTSKNTNDSSADSTIAKKTNNMFPLTSCGNSKCSTDGSVSNSSPRYRSDSSMHRTCSFCSSDGSNRICNRENSSSPHLTCCGSDMEGRSDTNSSHNSSDSVSSSNGVDLFALTNCSDDREEGEKLLGGGSGRADSNVQQQQQQLQKSNEQQFHFQDQQQQLRHVPADVASSGSALLHPKEQEVAKGSPAVGHAHAVSHREYRSNHTCVQQKESLTAAVAAQPVVAPETSALETALKAELSPTAAVEGGPTSHAEPLEDTAAVAIAQGASSANVAVDGALRTLDVRADAAAVATKSAATIKNVDAAAGGDRNEGTAAAAGTSAATAVAASVAKKSLPVPVSPGSAPAGGLNETGASVAAAACSALTGVGDTSNMGSTVGNNCSRSVSPSQEILATLVQQKEQLVQVLKQLLLHQQQDQVGELLPTQQQQHVLPLLEQQEHHPHRCLGQQQSQATQVIPQDEQAALQFLQQHQSMELLLHEQQQATQLMRSQQQQLEQLLLLQRLREQNAIQHPVSPRTLIKTLLWHSPCLPYTNAASSNSISKDCSGGHISNKGACCSSCSSGIPSGSRVHAERFCSSTVEEQQATCCRLAGANDILNSNIHKYEAAASAAGAVESLGGSPTAKQQPDAASAGITFHDGSPPTEDAGTVGPSMPFSPRSGEKTADARAAAARATAETELHSLLLSPDDLQITAAAPAQQRTFLQSLYGMPAAADDDRHLLLQSLYAMSPTATPEHYHGLHPNDVTTAAAHAADAEQHNLLSYAGGLNTRAANEALDLLQQHGREAVFPSAKRFRKDSSARSAAMQSGYGRGAAAASCGRRATAATFRRLSCTSGTPVGGADLEGVTGAPASGTRRAALSRRSGGVSSKRDLATAGNSAAGAPRKSAATLTGRKEQADAIDYAVRARTCERVSGVCFDRWNQGWIATWRNQRRPVHKHYSVKKYGFEQARLLAIHHRHCMILKQQQEQQLQLQQDQHQGKHLQQQLKMQQEEQLQRLQWHLAGAKILQQQQQPPKQHHLLPLQETGGQRSECAPAVLTVNSNVVGRANPEKETAADRAPATTTSSAQQTSLPASQPTTTATEAARAAATVAPPNVNNSNLIGGGTTEPTVNPAASMRRTVVPQVYRNSGATPQPLALLAHGDSAYSTTVALSTVPEEASARAKSLPTPREAAAALSILRLEAAAVATPKSLTEALKRGAAATGTTTSMRVHATTTPPKEAAAASIQGALVPATRRKQLAEAAAAAAVLESPRTPEYASGPAVDTTLPRAEATSMYWDRFLSTQQESRLPDIVTTKMQDQKQQHQVTESWADVETLVARMPKVERVSFDFTNHSWIAQWKQQGSATYRRFAVSKFGFHGAFQLAVLYKEQHYRPVAASPSSPTADASAFSDSAAAGGTPVASRQRRRRGTGGGVHRSKTSKKQQQQQRQQQQRQNGEQEQKQQLQREQQQQHHHKEQSQQQDGEQAEQKQLHDESTTPHAQHLLEDRLTQQEKIEDTQQKAQFLKVQEQQQQQQATPEKKRTERQPEEWPSPEAPQLQQQQSQRQQQTQQENQQKQQYGRATCDTLQQERLPHLSGRHPQQKHDPQHRELQNCVVEGSEQKPEPDNAQQRQTQQSVIIPGREDEQHQALLDIQKKGIQSTGETNVPVDDEATTAVVEQQADETSATYVRQGEEEQKDKQGHVERVKHNKEAEKPLARSLQADETNYNEVAKDSSSSSSMERPSSTSSCNNESTTAATEKLAHEAERSEDAAVAGVALQTAKHEPHLPAAVSRDARANGTRLLQTADAASTEVEEVFSTEAPMNPYLECMLSRDSMPLQTELEQQQHHKEGSWLLLQHQQTPANNDGALSAELDKQYSETRDTNRENADRAAFPMLPPLECPVALSAGTGAYPPGVVATPYPTAATLAAYPAAATVLACPAAAPATHPSLTPVSPVAAAVPGVAHGAVAAAAAATAAPESPSGEPRGNGGVSRGVDSRPATAATRTHLQEPAFAATATTAAPANASHLLQAGPPIGNRSSPDADTITIPPSTAGGGAANAKGAPGTPLSAARTSRKTLSATVTGGQEMPLNGRPAGNDPSTTSATGLQPTSRPATLTALDPSAYSSGATAASPTTPRTAAAIPRTEDREATGSVGVAAAGAGETATASIIQNLPASRAASPVPSWMPLSAPQNMWSSPFSAAYCMTSPAAAVAVPHLSASSTNMGAPLFASYHQNAVGGAPTVAAASNVAGNAAAAASDVAASDTAAPTQGPLAKTLLHTPQQLHTQQVQPPQAHDQHIHSQAGRLVWLQQVGPPPEFLRPASPATATLSTRGRDTVADSNADPAAKTGLVGSINNHATDTTPPSHGSLGATPADAHERHVRDSPPWQYPRRKYQRWQQEGPQSQPFLQHPPEEGMALLHQQQQQEEKMRITEQHKEQGDNRGTPSAAALGSANSVSSRTHQQHEGQQTCDNSPSAEQNTPAASTAQEVAVAVAPAATVYAAAGDYAAAHAAAATPVADGCANAADVPEPQRPQIPRVQPR